MQWFRGGLVFEAHRLLRLKDLLGTVTRVNKKKKLWDACVCERCEHAYMYACRRRELNRQPSHCSRVINYLDMAFR